jgi:SAM-dependent methyltransferase
VQLASNFCKVCGGGALQEIAEYRSLPRVTSDCTPFRSGGRLLVCETCGAAQSPADRQWSAEIGEIYAAYRSFQQYGGPEQHVLDGATGQLRRRSQVLLDRMATAPGFPRGGTVLDVGCGGGATLRAFSERGCWRLFGQELDGRDLPLLRAIPGFEMLFTCPLPEIPRRFDLVTMVHSLEHFIQPAPALRDLRSKIAPGGRLFVEVPDAGINPFDCLVADHMVHFTAATLGDLAVRAGFAPDCVSTTWVTKELSLVAYPNGTQPHRLSSDPEHEVRRVRAQVKWLAELIETAHQAASAGARFGLFGSTIAATWLYGVLGDRVDFFVEEDTNRVGRTHLDRPIYSPQTVPRGSVVFLALAPHIARHVAARVSRSPIDLRIPAAMPVAASGLLTRSVSRKSRVRPSTPPVTVATDYPPYPKHRQKGNNEPLRARAAGTSGPE